MDCGLRRANLLGKLAARPDYDEWRRANFTVARKMDE
jgi:hypothetical protein